MEMLQFWLMGFSVAIQPINLLYCFLGCIMGTLVGVLPGLGPAAGTAILIPVTFTLDPIGGIIMLSAIYYGAMYGGTITSVLVNVPGEGASVVTCLDGYQMARKGRAGPALGIAAIGSFVGGTLATLALMVVSLPLATFALRFGNPEMFSLVVFGLCLVTGLSGGSRVAALIMTMFGVLLAMIGIDIHSGSPRFTFGIINLYEGVDFIAVVMGLFGVSEVLLALEDRNREIIKAKLTDLLPKREEIGICAKAIGRGSIVGFSLGLIPGVNSMIPTFIAYALEKTLSKHSEKFGTGIIEGVASPETANNAYANAAMIPMLTLGIPASATLAVLVGAFTVHGLSPGPLLFVQRPDVVWGLIASLYVGNLMLLILNLPFVGVWAKLLEIRNEYLYPAILVFCIIGSYSLNGHVFDVGVMIVFGALGYIFKKIDWPLAPVVLALVLTPMMEKNLRHSLEMSAGDLSIFLTRPICAVFLLTSVVVLVAPGFRRLAQKAGKDDGN